MARRRTSLLSPAVYLSRNSVRRGLLGDSALWRVVFVVVFGRRLLRKVMGAEPELLSVEKLKPGQFVRIEALDPATVEPTKKRRRSRTG